MVEAEHEQVLVRRKKLAELVRLVSAGTLSGKMAKDVFAAMVDSGESAARVVERLGLRQIHDEDALLAIIDRVLAELNAAGIGAGLCEPAQPAAARTMRNPGRSLSSGAPAADRQPGDPDRSDCAASGGRQRP